MTVSDISICPMVYTQRLKTQYNLWCILNTIYGVYLIQSMVYIIQCIYSVYYTLYIQCILYTVLSQFAISHIFLIIFDILSTICVYLQSF